jgi:ubiquinone/menaquinone biosynthesis C-methylase UbiE
MAFADPQQNLEAFGLTAGMEIADLGAGPGHYTLAAARLVGEDGHVCAVEIQRDLVSKVKNEAVEAGFDNVDVVWSDLEKPAGSTLADESVDAVILSNILFQLKDIEIVLEESQRILRTGGRVLVIDWSDSYGGLGPPADHLIKREIVTEVATQVGFIISDDVDPGAHHWGVILEKISHE